MAQDLGIDKEEFIKACQKADSVDELMQIFELSRDQVKYLRKRLKQKGYTLKVLKPRQTRGPEIDRGYKERLSPWKEAKIKLGTRVTYCDWTGYKLDGKAATIQVIIKAASESNIEIT